MGVSELDSFLTNTALDVTIDLTEHSVPEGTKSMTRQELLEITQGIRSPEQVSMTLAAFLENDIEGYEYVKGELVLLSPATRIHSKISVKVIRYLDRYVDENQLGEVHVEATFQVGDRALKPDVAFVSTPRLDGVENTDFPIPPDLALRSLH